ncbi:MAG: class I SAM-dependent methyltransferase [Thermoprotei archaeon]
MSEQIMKDIMKLYNSIARDFDITRTRPWKYIIEYSQKKHQLIVADLGCGNGRHTIPYASKGHYTIALDISEEMLKITRSKAIKNKVFHNIDIIQASLTHIPLRKNVINLIICIATLHHIPEKINRIKALKEMYEKLDRNGLLIITVWNLLQLRHIKNIIKTLVFTKKLKIKDVYVTWKHRGSTLLRYYHLYTKKELYTDFMLAGIKPKIFRLDITPSIFPQNLLAIAKKKH